MESTGSSGTIGGVIVIFFVLLLSILLCCCALGSGRRRSRIIKSNLNGPGYLIPVTNEDGDAVVAALGLINNIDLGYLWIFVTNASTDTVFMYNSLLGNYISFDNTAGEMVFVNASTTANADPVRLFPQTDGTYVIRTVSDNNLAFKVETADTTNYVILSDDSIIDDSFKFILQIP